jgi:hypothetical protein
MTYLRTDLHNEAITALEICGQFSRDTTRDNGLWKWVIISLHNALQGFMCLALQGSDGLRVLKDDVAKAWLTAHDQGLPLPVEKLDWFPNLYIKIKSDVMKFNVNSKPFPNNDRINTSVTILNEYRNNFVHFLPQSWSINIASLPSLCLDCIAVIKFLVDESGNITWYQERNRSRALTAIKVAEDLFNNIKSREH